MVCAQGTLFDGFMSLYLGETVTSSTPGVSEEIIRLLVDVLPGNPFVSCPTHKLSLLDCEPFQFLAYARVFCPSYERLVEVACRLLDAVFAKAALGVTATLLATGGGGAPASPAFPSLVRLFVPCA